MFNWPTEIEGYYLLRPRCPACKEYGALLLLAQTAGEVIIMCDECERLWNPPTDIDLETSFENDALTSTLRFATEYELQRAELPYEIKWHAVPQPP